MIKIRKEKKAHDQSRGKKWRLWTYDVCSCILSDYKEEWSVNMWTNLNYNSSRIKREKSKIYDQHSLKEVIRIFWRRRPAKIILKTYTSIQQGEREYEEEEERNGRKRSRLDSFEKRDDAAHTYLCQTWQQKIHRIPESLRIERFYQIHSDDRKYAYKIKDSPNIRVDDRSKTIRKKLKTNAGKWKFWDGSKFLNSLNVK